VSAETTPAQGSPLERLVRALCARADARIARLPETIDEVDAATYGKQLRWCWSILVAGAYCWVILKLTKQSGKRPTSGTEERREPRTTET